MGLLPLFFLSGGWVFYVMHIQDGAVGGADGSFYRSVRILLVINLINAVYIMWCCVLVIWTEVVMVYRLMMYG